MTSTAQEMEDQKAIALLDVEAASYEEVLAAIHTEASQQPSELARSTVARQIDDQEPKASREPLINKPFPFMKLALELRTEIYKAHLKVPGTIAIFGGEYYNSVEVRRGCELYVQPQAQKKAFDISVLKLLAVSKTIFYEAVPVFFRYNTFRFDGLARLSTFLNCIGPIARRNVTSVSIGYAGKAPARAMKLLKGCIGLRELTIELSLNSLGLMPHPAHFDLMRMHGLTDLLKIRGIEKLVVIAAPNMLDYFTCIEENLPGLKQALQVLKQPHRPDQLKRQENKDFPEKATRTFLGKANVKTRNEKKFMAAMATSHSQSN